MLRILTTALTSPDLLDAQLTAFGHHIASDYKVIVVNDAYPEPHFSNLWTEGMPDQIRDVVRRHGRARHYRFPQQFHTRRDAIFPNEPERFRDHNNANSRCADAIQYGVNVLLAESADPLLILDADMIPYRTVYPDVLLNQFPVWGVPQDRGPDVNYLWNGLLFVDPRRAKAMDEFNIDCGEVNGIPVDVGGMLYRFMAANAGQIGTFVRIPQREMLDPALAAFLQWDAEHEDHVGYCASELWSGGFIHLRGGGNWEVRDMAVARERVTRFVTAVSR